MTLLQIRESLNRLDCQALDNCEKYYDFINLYEAMKPLDNEEVKALNDAIKTKNPETINATMTGIQAKRDPIIKNRINNSPSAQTVESINISSEDDLNKIFEEEELAEGRHNLKPVKCRAIKSHKTYWSPYDVKEKEFAQYGTRFRYDTKQGCLDAIADPKNDLGYDTDKNTSINEAKVNLDKVPATSKEVSPRLEAAVNQLLIKGVTAKNKPLVSVWILIKLYYMTNFGDTSIGIPRKELLIAAGTPADRAEIASQSQTLLTRMQHDDGLIEQRSGLIYPTAKLASWIEGNNVFSNGKSGIDFRAFQGGQFDPEVIGARQSQPSNSEKSHAGKRTKHDSMDTGNLDTVSTDDNANPITHKEWKQRDFSMFEDLEPVNYNDLSVKPNKNYKINHDLLERMKKAYKKERHLSEDAEITEKDYNTDAIEWTCCVNGWQPKMFKRYIWGEIN